MAGHCCLRSLQYRAGAPLLHDAPTNNRGGGSHQCDSTYVGAGAEEATLTARETQLTKALAGLHK